MKIVLSVVLAILILGCSEEKKEVNKAVDTLDVKSAKTLKETKVEVKKVEKVVLETKKVVVETIEPAVEKVTSTVKKAEPTVKKVEKQVTATVAKVSKPKADGKVLFKKCAGCHGQSAELHALRKSQIIKGWEASKIVAALNGYKAGTYGSTMKGVMKSQIKGLSEDDINAVAKYISEL